jgi:UDP-N-acetylglucosamine:LPS N-acetylglucosamine transferase
MLASFLTKFHHGKINVLTFLFLFALAPLFIQSEPIRSSTSKKKILLLCSAGGYGHMAAANTLKNLLSDQYDFKVIYPIDLMRIWGVKSGDQLYNSMLQGGWIRSVNMITRHLAPKIFRSRKKKIESLISRQIQQEQPDIVISLIPFINCPASEAARKLGIPYLIITTDNDLRNWVHGLQGVCHPNFKVTVGSDLWCSREMLRKRNIPDSAIETIGLPVRPDFFDSKDRESLRQKYHIPANKPVVMVMIGGQGGATALSYAETIGASQLGVHLIVCAGKNKALAKELQTIPLHATNSMTIMEFTEKVSDLMAISDLIITKAGPGSITEAMVMQLPILIDATSPILSWEKANIDLIMHYEIGDFIEDFDEVETLVREFLFDSELRQKMKASYKKIPLNSFNQSIPSLVEEMIQ